MPIWMLPVILISTACPTDNLELFSFAEITQVLDATKPSDKNADLDQIEKFFVRNEEIGPDVLNSHLGYFFDRIRKSQNVGEYFPHESKAEAYKFLLDNLLPKKNLEIITKEYIDEQFSDLGLEFKPEILLHDPNFGAGADFGKSALNLYYDLQLKLIHNLATTPTPNTNSTGYTELNAENLKNITDGKIPNAVILVPDDKGHHEDRNAKNLVRALLRRPEVKWVGLEMLPENLQPFADTFIFEEENSKKWNNAYEVLNRYYANTWDALWSKKGEELAVFSILKEARTQKKRVIALDASGAYTLSTEGNQMEGLSWMLLRNYLWAKHTPKNGIGIVFGGEAHFGNGIFPLVPYYGIRVQDFLMRDGHKNVFFISQEMLLGSKIINSTTSSPPIPDK